jgi:hypothetical protein
VTATGGYPQVSTVPRRGVGLPPRAASASDPIPVGSDAVVDAHTGIFQTISVMRRPAQGSPVSGWRGRSGYRKEGEAEH